MTRLVSLDGIYRSASAATKQQIDNLAAETAVARLKGMGGDRPIAVPGPIIAFVARDLHQLDRTQAKTLVANGMPSAFSVVVHRNIPGLGGSNPSVDVAELLSTEGELSYWFAGSDAAKIDLDARSTILLSGQGDRPDIALFSTSLQYALAAAARDRNPPIGGTLREIVAEARDRALGQQFPRPVLASMSDRLAFIAEATSCDDARDLAARGAPPLVPLHVERNDLTGEARGPIADVVSLYEWTVRQPIIDEESGRILRFADGRDGVQNLYRSFGDKPRRLLCLDAGRLELESLRMARSARSASPMARRRDPFLAALAVSRTRQRQIAPPERKVSPSAAERAYGVAR